jgi:hypothetical protein
MFKPNCFIILLVLPALLITSSAMHAVANASTQPDPFVMDGSSIITAPGHLGIINGKLTVGTPHGQVARIDGLWAPPYVSSDFALIVEIFGKEVSTQSYKWWPYKVERRGKIDGVDVSSATLLAAGNRSGLVALTLRNTTQKKLDVPVAFKTKGTLDYCDFWEFSGARSSTATKAGTKQNRLTLSAGKLVIGLQGSCDDLKWDAKTKIGKQLVTLKPGETRTVYLAFAMDTSAEAGKACESIAAAPAKALDAADAVYVKQVEEIFQHLPRLVSDNKDLEKFYNRSLVHFITNRWDVPEFVLRPYYSTGSIRGGCVSDYLWNYGEIWEIMPLFDPAAHREHIKQFLKCDMTTHFSFNPIDGKAFGPLYMVNQEKIIGLIYYYIKNTGDTAFFDEVVDGKTVLQHVLQNATVKDDVSKPVELIDYGPSNSHLELRLRHDAYNHVMPDLNGRRHANYLRAARLAEIAGKPAPHLLQRAEALKKLLKQKLWNPQTKWLDFTNGKGKPETRWTVQMFKLFGSSVLDEETEIGLMSHLNEKEFLSEHGLHSLAKSDGEYDKNDVDNGGPGACTCFPPQIAERLYKAGQPNPGEDILKRCLWWGSRLPYWGDSIVAERMDYRHDTPLQCTVDGVTVAQAIIFGMFGVDAQFDGSILASPQPPSFARHVSLRGIKIRGIVFDIDVDDKQFKVTSGGKTISAPVGRTVSIKKNGRLELAADRKGAGEY